MIDFSLLNSFKCLLRLSKSLASTTSCGDESCTLGIFYEGGGKKKVLLCTANLKLSCFGSCQGWDRNNLRAQGLSS